MLELGCGQGRDSVFFAKLGCNIVAIDISENAIKFVERTKYDENLKNLQLVISDIQKSLNFQNLKFDMVYSNLSLQFFDLSKLSNIFSNISDVMSSGSFFLFSTKKAGDKYYNFGNKISDNAFEYKGITRFFFTKSELETLLEKNFTIISFEEDKHVNPDNTVSVWWKILVKK
jgi:SAM-dependent methyltransferase